MTENQRIEPKEINNHIFYEDPTTYCWRYNIPKSSILDYLRIGYDVILSSFLIFFIQPALILTILYLISLFSDFLALLIAIILFILSFSFCITIIVIQFLARFNNKPEFSEWIKRTYKTGFSFLTSTFLLFIMSSPLLFLDQFTGSIDNILSWYLYYLNSIINIITFEVSSLFGIELTDIHPTKFIGKLSVMIFRVLLVVGIIEQVYSLAREKLTTQEFIGTVKYFHGICKQLSNADLVEVQMIGTVNTSDHPLLMKASDFYSQVRKQIKPVI